MAMVVTESRKLSELKSFFVIFVLFVSGSTEQIRKNFTPHFPTNWKPQIENLMDEFQPVVMTKHEFEHRQRPKVLIFTTLGLLRLRFRFQSNLFSIETLLHEWNHRFGNRWSYSKKSIFKMSSLSGCWSIKQRWLLNRIFFNKSEAYHWHLDGGIKPVFTEKRELEDRNKPKLLANIGISGLSAFWNKDQ